MRLSEAMLFLIGQAAPPEGTSCVMVFVTRWLPHNCCKPILEDVEIGHEVGTSVVNVVCCDTLVSISNKLLSSMCHPVM